MKNYTVEVNELWRSLPGGPTITAYIPQNQSHDCAVVILPGGAYYLRAEHEVTKDFADKSSVDIPVTTESRVDPDHYRVPERTYNGFSVFVNNNTHFVIARNGDTFERIATTFALTERTLRRYNEVNIKSTADPIEGELIYIEQKQAKWFGQEATHTVKEGETLTSISQEYGLRLSKLAHMNRLKTTDDLQAGQTLNLK